MPTAAGATAFPPRRAPTLGTLSASNEYVGFSGTGNFTQSGGSNGTSGNLYVGYNSGSKGTYALSGGTDNISNNLYLGYNSSSSGSYTLSGGSLHMSGSEYVGYAGAGGLTQSAGTNSALQLFVANNVGSSGSYTLTGGSLSTALGESVGVAGMATFNQSGGTNATGGSLYVGSGNSGSGSYTLSGGSLSALTESVASAGSGTFTQSGGTNSTTFLSVGSHGAYKLSGTNTLGSAGDMLTIVSGGGLAISGTLDGGNVSGTLLGSNVNSVIVDLSAATIVNSQSLTMSVGTNSLVIVNSNSSGFASISLGAGSIAHTAGSTIVLTGTQGFGGWGTIYDPVSIASGTVAVTNTNYSITLYGGVSFTGNGNVQVASVYFDSLLSPLSLSSSMSGGSLSTPTCYVGNGGTGQFAQSGGTVNLGNGAGLELGYLTTGHGTYNLSGGSLAAKSESVGMAGTAASNFFQSGGTNALINSSGVATTLFIGYNLGSSGSYTLSGGILSAATEDVGIYGSGVFTQTGGTNTISSPSNALVLGANAGSTGIYNLNGGLLQASTISSGARGEPGCSTSAAAASR